jgi:hypothetical protein
MARAAVGTAAAFNFKELRHVPLANACTVAALSRSMICLGVRLGAKSAYQAEYETVGSSISPKVGISGAPAKRALLVVA